MIRGLAVLALVAATTACNGESHDDPDCHHMDLGSCGTACCKLLFKFKATPLAVKDSVQSVLSNGGPDGRYALTTTADGTFGFEGFGGAIPNWQYIGQATHTTPMPGTAPGVKTGPYRDTVNFVIYTDDKEPNVTTLRAFSISEINGALGDGSINYKNIIQVMRAVSNGTDTLAWTMTHEDGSCPLQK
eukprot:TRINITY_DN32081_c0_g1_i1.p2 TRINITY_DN32081_c0_g1~~TRINITY_DN32081_c0_g1_i1.p2  ORF type:complete len:188 (+),score=69.80 TRINITY_DN32081_c0_g1_i1:60-623(+)